MSPEPKSCGVLLVCGNPIKSFLLMKHVDRWDLPKGHLDPGETELECALRETEEETGISPEKIKLDPHFRYVQEYEVQSSRYGGHSKELRLKKLVIFLGFVDHEYEIQVTEHVGACWFHWDLPLKPIQTRTIDPLLMSVQKYVCSEEFTC